MSNQDWFKPNAIPIVAERVGCDVFENIIREYGVGFSCEWFGHKHDGDFAKYTVNTLCERSGIDKPFSEVNNHE